MNRRVKRCSKHKQWVAIKKQHIEPQAKKPKQRDMIKKQDRRARRLPSGELAQRLGMKLPLKAL